MEFNFEAMPPAGRYELLLSTVVPRPIALITTLTQDGRANAAPYSLFNVIGHDPPIVAVSVLPHAEHRLKDTGQNILETAEFVVNLVSEQLAEAMNVTCIDAPPDVDELGLAHLQTSASMKVKPPRIASSPVSLECRFVTSVSFAPNLAVLFGRVVHVHVADEFVIDAGTGSIDTPKLQLIGAMHGAKWYTRTSDLFAMERPTWTAWASQDKL